jgi:hypothetical protein
MPATNFFISYTGKDAGWAEWIGWQLEDAGFTVTVQAWDSRPGNDFVVWMDQAVRDADRILVVLSPDYEQALSFTVPEWSAAVGRARVPGRARDIAIRGGTGGPGVGRAHRPGVERSPRRLIPRSMVVGDQGP